MNPILIALDVPTAAAALALTDTLRGSVGGYKIGSQLFTAEGPSIVRTLAERGDKVFLDLKFHDIPNTVAGAVESASHLGAWMMNVHASGGPAMMSAAAEAADRAAAAGRPRHERRGAGERGRAPAAPRTGGAPRLDGEGVGDGRRGGLTTRDGRHSRRLRPRLPHRHARNSRRQRGTDDRPPGSVTHDGAWRRNARRRVFPGGGQTDYWRERPAGRCRRDRPGGGVNARCELRVEDGGIEDRD